MKNSNNSSLLGKTLVKSTRSFYYINDERVASFDSVTVSIRHDDRNRKVWLIVRADERTNRKHWIQVTVAREGCELIQSRIYEDNESFAKAIKSIEKKVNSNKF